MEAKRRSTFILRNLLDFIDSISPLQNIRLYFDQQIENETTETATSFVIMSSSSQSTVPSIQEANESSR